MPNRRAIQITTGRHPFEVAVMVASVFVGLVMVLTDITPRSASQTMSPAVLAMWEGLLIVSGVVALAGIFWRGKLETSLRVEMAGTLLMAGGISMYAVALLFFGSQALVAGGYCVALAAGAWWRSVQIAKDLRRVANATLVATAPLLMEDTGP